MDNNVAQRRAELQWSQARFAEERGVSRQTVISIEHGRFDPSLPLAFRIVALFDCSIEDVFRPDARGA